MTVAVQPPPHLSWSALSTYSGCGERYRLERMYHMPSGTWFATIAGKAIHEITEKIDRAHYLGFDFWDAYSMAPKFSTAFEAMLAEETGEVKPSGRKLKEVSEAGGPNKKDRDWWLGYGQEFVQRYVRWREERTDWEIAIMPDGKPAIEISIVIQTPGGRVIGFIDRIFYDKTCKAYIAVDIKTGEVPYGKLQLVTYGAGVLQQYGLRVEYGCYWQPRFDKDSEVQVGKLSYLESLDRWDPEQLEAMYSAARRGIEAGVFLPQVTSMCVGCGVRQYCWAVTGDKAKEVPILDEIVDKDGAVVFSGSDWVEVTQQQTKDGVEHGERAD